MSTLHPVHYSVRRTPRGQVRPNRMDTLQIPRDLNEGLTQIALDIFTACSNAGVGFADALTAVYLSGLNHGAAVKGDISGL